MMNRLAKATTILLADDHRLFREGVCSLLDNLEDLEVVGTVADGREALAQIESLKPDVVIMDIGMPNLNGIEATRALRAQSGTRTKVIALSMHADRHFVASMLTAGARGYLLKDCDFQELLRAIRTVMLGNVYLSPPVQDIIVQDYQTLVGEGVDGLTPRQREVLQLLAEGKSTKEAANLLSVSAKTVETHRRQIMLKVGAGGIAELTKYAIRRGVTTVE